MALACKGLTCALLCFLILASSSDVVAQEYVIGPEDVLQISFWQQPALNQTVTVRNDGKITVSLIGEVTAAGLTPEELAKKIGDRANYYNPEVSQASVTVLAYNSQKVFINGQVQNQGAYAFEVLPDVWELIKEAGGITEYADLSRVTIIRGSENAGEIETFNLDRLVSQGKLDEIPELNPGDIVEVPRMPGGISGTGLPKEGEDRRDVVYVTGAVGAAKVVPIEAEMDILDAIVMAGGSSADADLSEVKVISKHDGYSSVLAFDLEKYMETGRPRRYVLRPEDTVVLPRKGTGFFRLGWGTFRDIVAVATSVVSAYVLVDRLKDE